MDALLAAFARHLGLPPEAARPALDALLAALREGLDADGERTLVGVGRFLRSDEGLGFEPDPLLLAAVNAPFAGLPPIAPPAAAPEAGPETAPAEEEPADDAGAAPEPEEDAWAPLFSVPLEPVPLDEPEEEGTEPAEEDEELAAPVLDVPPEPALPPRPASPDEAPIAPLPRAAGAHPTEPETEPDEEADAFAAPEPPAEPPAPSPLPLRDLSSEEEAREEHADEEGEDLEAPIAVPFAPADDLEEAPPGDEAAGAETPEEEGLTDEQLDALLAGVWAPSAPPSPEHPLGPSSEPDIEDAEFDVVEDRGEATPAPTVEPEPADEPGPVAPPPPPAPIEHAPAEPAAEAVLPPEPPRPAPPLPFAATAPAPGPTPPPTPVRHTRERRRSRGLSVWLPLLVLLLAAVVIALLWPRLGDREEGVATPAELGPVAAPLPDTASVAARPDDTALAEAPVPEGATEADPSEASPPTAEATPPRPVSPPPQATPEQTPPPAQPAAPAEAPAASAGIPAPLRGPGGVDSGRGGATWVLASGSRAGAERDAANYRRQGYRADVLTGTAGGSTVYRVVVGQFSSFEEALRYRSSLPPGTPSGAWVLRL